jgi:hypothetical protein
MCFTVDMDTFIPVFSSIFTSPYAVVLELNCNLRTKVRSSLGDRTRLLPERYDGCVVPWCLYLRTIVCTDEHGTFRRLETEFEGRSLNTCTGTPPIDSNYVN